ncbi:hypothetical protein JCM8547_006439 [Rhodosporidiobolus lusitaniae]
MPALIQPAPPPPRATLLGTSSVPYSPLSPSPSALVKSDDGQYAIVTRAELNILTPVLGFASSSSSATAPSPALPPVETKGKEKEKAAKGKEKEQQPAAGRGKLKEREEIPWMRTVITGDTKNMVRWHQWVDDYDVVTPASTRYESYWRSASWSPSGLSGLGTCLLATLTANGEVLLFAPEKDSLKGEWNETCDLTSLLISSTIPADQGEGKREQTPQMRREAVAMVRRCQASAISWSSAVPGTGGKDHSFLALGHRSGEISLWRLTSTGSMRFVLRFRPDGPVNWINLLSWSSWTVEKSESGSKASACLAVADSDGRVWSIEVEQGLTGGEESVEVRKEVVVDEGEDGRGATQLLWVEHEGARHIAYTKLGTVSLASLSPSPSSSERWTKASTSEVELRTEGAKDWMGATAWAPCSGLHFLPSASSPSLLVSLSSGSFHHLLLSTSTTSSSADEPSALALSYSDDASVALTASSRTLFSQLLLRSKAVKERFNPEGPPLPSSSSSTPAVSRREGSKVLGTVLLGGSGEKGGVGGAVEVAWIYETERPGAFSYRTASGTRTYVVLGVLGGEGGREGEETGRMVREVVKRAGEGNAVLQAPLSTLQPLLSHLAYHAHSSDVVSSVLLHLSADDLPHLAPPPDIEEEGKTAADKVLGTLFGEKGIEELRVKEILARAVVKNIDRLPLSSDKLNIKQAALTVHNKLARMLVKEVVERMAAAIGSVPLSDTECPIHSRLLLASSALLPSPPSPSPEPDAENKPLDLPPPNALSQAFTLPADAAEFCPACRTPVALESMRFASCEGGHRWERCSLTLALVSSVTVRTCTACERKALIKLPSSAGGGGEGGGGGGVLDGVLTAVTCCVYCGGRWRRVR